MVLPLIPPAAVTLVAGALFVLILFGITDWFEILAIVVVIAFIAYMAPSILAEV